MATNKFQAHRVTALPSTLEPYSVYYVAPAGKPDYVEIYVSNSDGSSTKRVINEADVQALIASSLAGMGAGGVVVYDDIAERDADSDLSTRYAYVIDATADTTVVSGGANYLYNSTNTTWIKTSEAESLDVILDWDKIQNKPSSTAANIDLAVTQTHTHTNKSELDKIGQSAQGSLTYNGVEVATQWSTTAW